MKDDNQDVREPREREGQAEDAPKTPIRPRSILYENQDRSLVVIDIPRSLEESQVLPSELPALRIVSGEAPATPYATPEPRHGAHYSASQASSSSPAAQLAELMTTAAVQYALQHLTSSYPGPFSLPRILEPQQPPSIPGQLPHIPPKAEHLHGSVHAQRETFEKSAPSFDLVVLDPPWPNRSARRRTNKYTTVSNLHEMRHLLMHIPIVSHLNPDGLVAVWITNKHSIYDFLVSPAGLFAAWGLEVVAEWTWLKVTTSGEPLYDVESAWRKPWEKLVIAKRIGAKRPEKLRPKVIVAVPDVHSRKPNLKGLFQDVLGEDFLGLEIFARNLTAGWWSWGDEVLLFQQAEHWSRSDSA
ncbi:MT-A70-domain-containing protein [Thelonectria olida]|uniref:MT-A70-domain-containing protein n=1 Tax=Thelonectria olida TaxID=1576542 RepID=A0A9P9ATE4_9HYPO|nr:MT-A70-domain-containing protein [Thelonectria olida]